MGIYFEEFNKNVSPRKHEHFVGNWQKEFLDETIESLTHANCWVYIAELDSKPVGFVYSRYCIDCEIYRIEDLFVLDGYRKYGIGKKLLQTAIEVGKQNNHQIVVEVFDWNTNALEFYKKAGFHSDSHILVL